MAKLDRRTFLKRTAVTAASFSVIPSVLGAVNKEDIKPLMKRTFGNTGREVTTFGLGGQASIQWTPHDVDPVAIIMKAYNSGVNYFDTSNLYGPSQTNYGKAFNNLGLIPGKSGYNEKQRKEIFLTSKTHIRYAKGRLDFPGLNNWTNGDPASRTIDDLKRSLSQIFGDGKGNYPKGAYLDMVLLHDIANQMDVDAALTGMDGVDPKDEQIGALVALLDYRDGTNFTGLNPKEEKLITHLGFSGHWDASMMMQLIRRDKKNVFEGMLVAINANDKLNLNMQHNVIPVADAKGYGIVGMKTFADGAMYTKPATWSINDTHVVRQVGSEEAPYKELIQYSLTTPGIDTLIIGIGQISDNSDECQLSKNIEACQVERNGLTNSQRQAIEEMASKVKNGQTNYFQESKGGLSEVHNIESAKESSNKVTLSWDTAYAGDAPLKMYEIVKNGAVVGTVSHTPQTTEDKFVFVDTIVPTEKSNFKIVSVDQNGNRKETQEIEV